MAEVRRICTETIYEVEDVPLVTPQSGDRVSIHAISFDVGGFSIKMPLAIAARLAEEILHELPRDAVRRVVGRFRATGPSRATPQPVGVGNGR